MQFLFRQYSRNLGGILADDMGLGKTVQTIAFCAALLGKTGTQEDNAVRQSVAGKKCAAPRPTCISWKLALVQPWQASLHEVAVSRDLPVSLPAWSGYKRL